MGVPPMSPNHGRDARATFRSGAGRRLRAAPTTQVLKRALNRKSGKVGKRRRYVFSDLPGLLFRSVEPAEPGHRADNCRALI